MSDRHQTPLRIEPDHPCLPGHFPGAPVVPGVVLMEAVLDAAERWRGTPLHIAGVPQVKFLAPLPPGEAVQALLEIVHGVLRFRVANRDRTFAQGSFTLRAPLPP